jgi:competence protein ComEA
VSVPVQQIAADATAPSPVVLKTSSRKRSSGARKPRGEKSSRTASAKKITSGTISINAATVDELEELPGVGPSTAQSIIDFRTKAGGFSSLDELGDIPRMGQKKLAKLMPFIRL